MNEVRIRVTDGVLQGTHPANTFSPNSPRPMGQKPRDLRQFGTRRATRSGCNEGTCWVKRCRTRELARAGIGAGQSVVEA